MKSGRSIQDVSREILRQQEAKADYLVATDRLHMDTLPCGLTGATYINRRRLEILAQLC